MPKVEVQTLGPENFAPNTAKKIETAVKSRPGKAETTVSLALGPLGWLHLLNRWITIPMAYDLVDDAHIVVTDIVYEQGWSVRGARRMTGEGVDGKTQFEARLNLYMFGMSFILAPEAIAARVMSGGSGSGSSIDDIIGLFDEAVEKSPALVNEDVVIPLRPSNASPAQQLIESAKPIIGGGAKIENLTQSEIACIQSIADKYGLEITVVGSRAEGTASSLSDWDYIITGGNSKSRSSALYQLPRNLNAVKEGERRAGSEILKVELDVTKPHIIFRPQGN